jgi:hypothetical protein
MDISNLAETTAKKFNNLKKFVQLIILFVTLFLPLGTIIAAWNGLFGYGRTERKMDINLTQIFGFLGNNINNSNTYDNLSNALSSTNGYWIPLTLLTYIIAIIIGVLILLGINPIKNFPNYYLFFAALVISLLIFVIGGQELNKTEVLGTSIKVMPSWGYLGLLAFGFVEMFMKSDKKSLSKSLHDNQTLKAMGIDNIEIPEFAKDKLDEGTKQASSYFHLIENAFKTKNYEKLITYFAFPVLAIIALLAIEPLRFLTFWAVVAAIAYFGFKYVVAQEVKKAQSDTENKSVRKGDETEVAFTKKEVKPKKTKE